MIPHPRIMLFTRTLIGLIALGWALAAQAGSITDRWPQVRGMFPAATDFGELVGQPAAAAVFRNSELLGYAFLSSDAVRIPAYSGKPINTLIAIDARGRITGVQIVEHEEPILVVGVSDQDLQRYAGQYVGKSVFDKVIVGAPRPGHVAVDTISGATITVMVENATIMRAAERVARSRGLVPGGVMTAVPAKPAASPAPAAPPASAAETVHDPIWPQLWHERVASIVLLLVGLTVLTLILVFQDWLARRPKLLQRLRTGFLLYTLLFIGWFALAQLSVVNVLTFAHAAMHDFRWDTFLIDPLIFILWSFVAVTLLLWGRGVYCGWLCPFGALQELGFQLGQKLRIPKYDLPQMVHERMWALKYVLLLALFGLSLQSLPDAERVAELEPFKTVITLRFEREWGFVLYAAALIGVGLVNRKFYCKYLCALGAALTIPAKFRIFDWLRRHRECGRPCQICAVECEVQAIKKNGEINPNECHYCLDCQVTYWSERKCPPLVDRRKRREKAERAREVVRSMEHITGPSGLDQVAPRPGPGPENPPRRNDPPK